MIVMEWMIAPGLGGPSIIFGHGYYQHPHCRLLMSKIKTTVLLHKYANANVCFENDVAWQYPSRNSSKIWLERWNDMGSGCSHSDFDHTADQCR